MKDDLSRPPFTPLLAVEDLWVSYDRIDAVRGVSFDVGVGEIVTLIGANGAGKSSILQAISGMLPVARGRVTLEGLDLLGVPAHLRVARGIAHVPEGRGIFGNLTVLENLRLATYRRRDGEIQHDLEEVFQLFPRLAERRRQWGNTLSGGEQQMLAVGRALMSRARLLLLDEPSMGLAPAFGPGDLPGDPTHQPAGRRHPAGGAKRPPGPGSGASRLYPGDRGDCAGGAGLGTAAPPPGPGGLPGRGVRAKN